jgi:D-amino-acid oxidase
VAKTIDQVAVVGCGVIGLTSGIRLLERGLRVTILAREVPPQTTSNVAGAYWAPGTLFSSPEVQRWSRRSHHDLQALAAEPDSGVSLRTLVELFDGPLHGLPRVDLLADLRRVEPHRYPAPGRSGYQLTVPVVDPPIYMPFLVRRFQALGGTIELQTVTDLAALTERYPLVVNCSGVWARQLAQDPLVFPIRGQVVWVCKPEGLAAELVDCSTGHEATYIIPRQGECLLGGTFEDYNWNPEPDQATAEAIIRRCVALNPLLRDAEVIAHKVGLRPGRPTVRLEIERLSNRRAIIHNYGHGAVGHTLAWGCAAEVVELVVRGI